jgi:hypothetical protein
MWENAVTRKHFIALASELKYRKPHTVPPMRWTDAIGGWQAACEAVANAAGRFNPAFDRERFLKACGYYG